ncbi:MAG: phosphatase PAP2 family protein [Parvibaculum sp.]|nr:phosphatase PAP2 family protein [Parvibaculum sp.]
MAGRDIDIFERRWNKAHLAVWGGLSILLFGSWLLPATREIWDVIDVAFFRALNETVTWGQGFAAFWALTGDRLFDVFSALVLAGFYLIVITRGGMKEFRHGLAFGAATVVLLGLVIMLQREMISFPRYSPSMALDTYHSIQDFIGWSRAKEGSNTSFPGDHATVSMLLTLAWWLAYGWRVGLIAAGLTVIFTLPRLAAGAHWLTDVLVGGGFVTFAVAALFLGTPALHHAYGFFRQYTDRMTNRGLAAYERVHARVRG